MRIAYLSFFLFSTASGFAPQIASMRYTGHALAAVLTGPKGKAASSKEEDLMLTLQIIMDHQQRSTTVSVEQFLSQQKAIEKLSVEPEKIDVSIPYDAAARLAYETSDKAMKYVDFKAKYEMEAVELVKSKRPVPAKSAVASPSVDVSIPYDAAAKLAYEGSNKSMSYNEFKGKYEADTIAMVKSKRPVDLSIPYDAAARLAFHATDRKIPYEMFKADYEAKAVAEVTAKQKKA